jgi:hypothetical protein
MGRSLAIPALFLDSKGLKPREELRSVLRINAPRGRISPFTFRLLPFTSCPVPHRSSAIRLAGRSIREFGLWS